MACKVFFYPHYYLRDRHLETIRSWPSAQVCNPEVAMGRRGQQVSRSKAITGGARSWKQILPLLNLKLRPSEAPHEAVIYLWGGVVATGPFIVDLDNPWSLVGYNVSAMPLYKPFIKWILLSERCLEIRCMSEACRLSLRQLFGEGVYRKSVVHYPVAGLIPQFDVAPISDTVCRFLFVGSQFEIKGGYALLEAYKRAYAKNPRITLDVITHLPDQYKDEVKRIPGINVYPPEFSRDELISRFMKNADVLVHPSYMESFGMTILEGISNGLAIISNDIYAIKEMVVDKKNGYLLIPPVSKWNGVLPNENFMKKTEFIDVVREADVKRYVDELEAAILHLSTNPAVLIEMKQYSLSHFKRMSKNA